MRSQESPSANRVGLDREDGGPGLRLENEVERLTARVGENKDGPSFVTRERQRLGRPRGLKFGCERVFVLQASQTLGQRLFRGRSYYQNGRWVAVAVGPGKA